MDNSELEKDLLKACQANNIKATKEALLHINDVNFFDHLGNSPLWYCVIDNHFEILDLLIKHGANLYEKNYQDHSILGGLSSIKMLHTLLEYGMDIHYDEENLNSPLY